MGLAVCVYDTDPALEYPREIKFDTTRYVGDEEIAAWNSDEHSVTIRRGNYPDYDYFCRPNDFDEARDAVMRSKEMSSERKRQFINVLNLMEKHEHYAFYFSR